jgi:hypothetical protein
VANGLELVAAFTQRLRELGWIEGRTVTARRVLPTSDTRSILIFAAPHESASGTFETSTDVRCMAAFWGKPENISSF